MKKYGGNLPGACVVLFAFMWGAAVVVQAEIIQPPPRCYLEHIAASYLGISQEECRNDGPRYRANYEKIREYVDALQEINNAVYRLKGEQYGISPIVDPDRIDTDKKYWIPGKEALDRWVDAKRRGADESEKEALVEQMADEYEQESRAESGEAPPPSEGEERAAGAGEPGGDAAAPAARGGVISLGDEEARPAEVDTPEQLQKPSEDAEPPYDLVKPVADVSRAVRNSDDSSWWGKIISIYDWVFGGSGGSGR